MKYTLHLFTAILFCTTNLFAQNIMGNLKSMANQEITLQGFNGLQNYAIASTKIDEKGNFKLNFTPADYGMGYLVSSDKKIFLLVLSGENTELIGETISDPKSITITKGHENQWFEQYASEHTKRQQALSAWEYLEKIYNQEALFAGQKIPNKAIIQEQKRINSQDASFLNSLPKDSYCRWFLPVRKLVSSVSVVAQYRTQEIPITIAAFRALNYTDNRLYKSGLFKDAIESHFWLLENCGKPLDSVFIEMQKSIDAMMIGLVNDEKKLNEVSDYLFNLLEKHSLFNASEYLAIRLLSEKSCTINSDLAKQLETYRSMKKGNTAPNIVFPKATLYPAASNQVTQLKDIKSKYTLVVFGASWCPKCKEEIPEIAKHYSTWKKNDVEVLFVSLDENDMDFINFASSFPFISMCDYQKWNSPIAQNYYVFGTPTMYLLDKEQKIILRPNSVKQMEAWVDWYLVKGNAMPVIDNK